MTDHGREEEIPSEEEEEKKNLQYWFEVKIKKGEVRTGIPRKASQLLDENPEEPQERNRKSNQQLIPMRWWFVEKIKTLEEKANFVVHLLFIALPLDKPCKEKRLR